MALLSAQSPLPAGNRPIALDQREYIKQELRRRIQEALHYAKELPPEECLNEIRTRLVGIQLYCQLNEKTFIVVEESIRCNQYDLGGDSQDAATLFRGPSQDASVAVCVTDKGSLLHRNGKLWKVYRSAGDIGSELL